MPDLLISSVTDDGSHYKVGLTKTGPDTAGLDITEWAAGVDPTGMATTDNSYDLYGIRKTGSGATCLTDAFFQTPQIDLVVTPGDSPNVSIVVTHTWFNPAPQVYPISAADCAALQSFLGQFPAA